MRKILCNLPRLCRETSKIRYQVMEEKIFFYYHLYCNNSIIWFLPFFDPCAERVESNLRKEMIICRINLVNIASFPVMTLSWWKLPGLCFRRSVWSKTDCLAIYRFLLYSQRENNYNLCQWYLFHVTGSVDEVLLEYMLYLCQLFSLENNALLMISF